MAEETLVLILLVIVMLMGSYVAGSIPLKLKLSERKLKLVTVLGAGLLVGTALTVIIPEGIRSLYMDISDGHPTIANPPVYEQSPIPVNTHPTHHKDDHTRVIGLSLILGFVFMLLVDQISQRKNSASDKNITATLGLVFHSAADGVALGAAASTSHQDVEIIVFLAIMLHKAPAAFGLVSFLMHEKIDLKEIRKHLLIFSLSAPLFTLLTYFGIGQEQKETLNSVNATGIAMLFSAGTFLYVATVHVLPELTQGVSHHSGDGRRPTDQQHGKYEYRALESSGNEGVDIEKRHISASPNHKGMRCSELSIMVCGALLPLVISFGHEH